MRTWMFVVMAAACGSGHTTKPDAPPLPTMTVYLSFDGEMIQPTTAGNDNAAMNLSSIITTAKTAPAYLNNVPTRADTIAQIVSETQARFAPFDVDIVTNRPTSGDYFMIVFTGEAKTVLGTNGASAITTENCPTPPNKNGIAFEFQNGSTSDTFTPVQKANLTIPSVALAQLVPPTSTAGDCMCWSATSCAPVGTTPCTIGGAGTVVDAPHSCSGAPGTDDEMSLLQGVFGTAH